MSGFLPTLENMAKSIPEYDKKAQLGLLGFDIVLQKLIQLPRGYNAFREARGKLSPLIRDDSALWQQHKSAARAGPKVLIATSLGGCDSGAYLESVLAMALTLRSADVHVLLCDQALPACQMAKLSAGDAVRVDGALEQAIS